MNRLARAGFIALGLILIYGALYLLIGPFMESHVSAQLMVAEYMGVWTLMLSGLLAIFTGIAGAKP